jgi:imidazolonepropionase-like amidohydrolase
VLAIKDARVLSMNEAGSFEKATVVVDGDSIVELGENPSLAQDCELIHASGKYLLPGFIDSHNHIGLEEEIYRIEGSDVNEIADPITPQLRALDGINFWDLAFTDALRGGVTRSLTMPGSANLIGGQAVFLKHLAARPADMVYKHPWGLKAALGENPKRVYAEQKKSPITRMANASLLREALYTAARNMDRVDRTASEVFKQDPLQKVLKQEMPLLVHAHRADDIMTALRIKDEFNIKMIIQHGTEALEVLQAFRMPLDPDNQVFLTSIFYGLNSPIRSTGRDYHTWAWNFNGLMMKTIHLNLFASQNPLQFGIFFYKHGMEGIIPGSFLLMHKTAFQILHQTSSRRQINDLTAPAYTQNSFTHFQHIAG